MTVTQFHPARSPVWADDLREVLGRVPTRTEDLQEMLGEFEVTADELERELRTRADVCETDAGWVHLFGAADGVVLTHVLEEDELDHGVLVADGDLDLWARLADEGLGLADGGEVRRRWAGGPHPLPVGVACVLAGPDGWLDAYQPGQMLALRLQDDYLSIEALDVEGPDHTVVRRCAQVAQHTFAVAAGAVSTYLNDDGETPWALLDDVIASLVAADADVLAEPLPPLGMLLASAGMQSHSGLVALAGVPELDEVDEFDAAEIGGLVLAHAALGRMAAGDAGDVDDGADLEDVERLRQFLYLLELPVVAERVADSVEERPLPEDTVQALLDAAASDAQRGLALLLAARSAEGSGDYLAAERRIDEACGLLPACVPVASDAGQYAAARGDVVRADAILRGSGCQDDDPLRQAIKPLLKKPEGVVSRNRPCPCGSGRKYKVCCLRHVSHPLPARAGLAYVRLICHGQRPGLLENVARFARPVDGVGIPVSVDMALFDGGVARDYIDRRGHLLADDERWLVESWCETPLAPYEVTDVRLGRSVTLRPLLGGEPVVLADRTLSCVARLDVLVARPLWDGVRPVLLSHPGHVHRMRRAALLALFDEDGGYDPDEVAAFFGPQPPAKLRNRDGEDLVLCEAVYDVDDDAAWGRLGEHLVADDEDGDRLVLEGREVGDEEFLIRGSVTREGERWTVDTNSRERFEELRRLVLDAAPAAVLVSESAKPAADVVSAQQDGGDRPAAPFGVSDDVDIPPGEQQHLMDEYMQTYEKRWVDEELPALGGRTPREAVDEGGTALAEVEAMLDDIAWMHRANGGGMDANRLRRHLGLKATAGQ